MDESTPLLPIEVEHHLLTVPDGVYAISLMYVCQIKKLSVPEALLELFLTPLDSCHYAGYLFAAEYLMNYPVLEND